MESIRKEMEAVGIDSCGGEDHEGFEKGINMDEFERYPIDPLIKAVVVGQDTQFTYAKLCLASLHISTGGAKFIATNNDAFDMVNGRRQPGAGAMVDSIKVTLSNPDGSRNNTEPEIIGKPNPYVIDLIMKEHGIADKSKYDYVHNCLLG